MQRLAVYGCRCCQRLMTRPYVAAARAPLRCHLPCARCKGPCRKGIALVPEGSRAAAAPKAGQKGTVRRPLAARPPPLFKRPYALPVARVWAWR
jgi:hypothetical protein